MEKRIVFLRSNFTFEGNGSIFNDDKESMLVNLHSFRGIHLVKTKNNGGRKGNSKNIGIEKGKVHNKRILEKKG